MPNTKLVVLATACSMLTIPLSSRAEVFPSRPIRVIVPYAAGGADQQIRPLLPALQKILGQPVIIENKGGAGGMIGAKAVQHSSPDGYTLLYTATAVLTVAPKLNPGSYNTSDFQPVCNVIDIPFVVARSKKARFDGIEQLRSYAKAHPGAVNFGSAGLGTATHLGGEMLAKAMDVQMQHVPFQGMVPAVSLLVSGGIDMVVGAPSVVMPQVRGGTIVGLATTGAKRFEGIEDLPTLKEKGVNVDTGTKYGFFAPKGTPMAAVAILSDAIEQSMQSQDYATIMRKGYNGVHFMNAQQYANAIAEESRSYDALITELGLNKKR